ncbi:radical SAM protein [bacterium]|nr:radical SAM protein [bacterium]
MKYEGSIYRPPSEAESLILQVTVGCSHNRCTFCPAYKDKKFRFKSREEIFEDIEEAGEYVRRGARIRRIFLADGDALILPQKELVWICDKLNENIPGLQRIGIYGNTKSILRKTLDELIELRDKKMTILYYGLETGDDVVREITKKGSTSLDAINAGVLVKKAGIKLSITIMLGIGGVERSREHAVKTGEVLSKINPDYVGALTTMVVPGTPLYSLIEASEFELPNIFGLLYELRMIIFHSSFSNCLFFSNHASNYLPIKARLPREKDDTLALIDTVIKDGDRDNLRPEFLRGL